MSSLVRAKILSVLEAEQGRWVMGLGSEIQKDLSADPWVLPEGSWPPDLSDYLLFVSEKQLMQSRWGLILKDLFKIWVFCCL